MGPPLEATKRCCNYKKNASPSGTQLTDHDNTSYNIRNVQCVYFHICTPCYYNNYTFILEYLSDITIKYFIVIDVLRSPPPHTTVAVAVALKWVRAHYFAASAKTKKIVPPLLQCVVTLTEWRLTSSELRVCDVHSEFQRTSDVLLWILDNEFWFSLLMYDFARVFCITCIVFNFVFTRRSIR